MQLIWNEVIATLLKKHLNDVLHSKQNISELEHSIALKETALPVYSDLSGFLLINIDGNVLFYNYETDEVVRLTDEKWNIIAAISAIEKYPDLIAIIPAKPQTSKQCESCLGTGRILKNEVICGSCKGLGWVL